MAQNRDARRLAQSRRLPSPITHPTPSRRLLERALAANKASRIAAAWSQNWELYRTLSQEHERLKKRAHHFSTCAICGVAIKSGSNHCHMHSRLILYRRNQLQQ